MLCVDSEEDFHKDSQFEWCRSVHNYSIWMFVPCIWNSAKFLCCFPNEMVHKTNCHLILKKNNIISFNMDHSLYRDSMWIWRQFTYLYYLFTKTYLAHGGEKRKFCLNVESSSPEALTEDTVNWNQIKWKLLRRG